MKSNIIFKRDSKGLIRTWQYEVEGHQWRSISGLMNGVKTTSEWTTCVPKSKPTAEAQALFEAQAENTKKLDRDYRLSMEEVDRPRASVVKPMLAHKYESWNGRCFSQPKLDGIRCLATKDGLFSRQGKPILGVPHVEAALLHFFVTWPDHILDGELYNHDLKDDFNAIVSVVKKQKPTDEEVLKAADLIQYHIYDCPTRERHFCGRSDFISSEVDFDPMSPLRRVDTTPIESEAQLNEVYGRYLTNGYEGQMVRMNGFYEQKRSKMLLKRKEFIDAEFPVVAIEEGQGNWAGFAKRATLRLKDGREFGAGIKGSQAEMKALLDGTKPAEATVRYFALTPDGIPRFPIAVAFHEQGRSL